MSQGAHIKISKGVRVRFPYSTELGHFAFLPLLSRGRMISAQAAVTSTKGYHKTLEELKTLIKRELTKALSVCI